MCTIVLLLQVFGESLTTACNALTVFATQDTQLTGKGASLSREGRETRDTVLGACMGVVSPCVLACGVVRDTVRTEMLRVDASVKTTDVVARMQQCQMAVMRNASKLAESLIRK